MNYKHPQWVLKHNNIVIAKKELLWGGILTQEIIEEVYARAMLYSTAYLRIP